MKVAVMNFSGNVGKSTVSRQLLAPRLENANVIAVESINSDGTESEAIKGKQFGELTEALAVLDNAVIDIGASNVEDFIKRMTQYHGSHEDFDLFVVPTIPNAKQQRDTVSTIEALNEIGVPAKKIRVVFNMLDQDDSLEKTFSGIFAYHENEKKFTLNTNAVIHLNDIYDRIKETGQNISDVLNDPTDYKELLKSETNPDEKIKLSRRVATKRLASLVTLELDSVFKALMK